VVMTWVGSPSTLLGPEATGRLMHRCLVAVSLAGYGCWWVGVWVWVVCFWRYGSLGRTQTSRLDRCWCVRDAWVGSSVA
jgi:hypothetical protein